MTLNVKEEEFLLQNNKVFYKGIIEDNNDPEHLGRYKIRINGIHSQDKSAVPTSTLPWAFTINPLIFGFDKGVGISSIANINTWVWCFFDNDDINTPIIVGALIAKNDLNQKTRNNYLNTHIIETKTGHYIDITDGGHIQIYHNSGTNAILHQNGDITVISKNVTNNVDGSVTNNITANMVSNVDGDTTNTTGGNITYNASRIDMN